MASCSRRRPWAFAGDESILSTLVSTGGGRAALVAAPHGHVRVSVKFLEEAMEGTVSGEDYRVEDVQWVMYFADDGRVLHGPCWRQNLGHPMRRGRVELPLDLEEWMFSWATEGTTVTIVPQFGRRRRRQSRGLVR